MLKMHLWCSWNEKFRSENILTPTALKEVGVLDQNVKTPDPNILFNKMFHPTTPCSKIVFTTYLTLFLDVQYLQESDGDWSGGEEVRRYMREVKISPSTYILYLLLLVSKFDSNPTCTSAEDYLLSCIEDIKPTRLLAIASQIYHLIDPLDWYHCILLPTYMMLRC